MALAYVALVPAVCVLALIGAAAYFPGPTRTLLGPTFRSLGLVPEEGAGAGAAEALARTSAAEARLGKIEADIAAVAKRIEQKPEEQTASKEGQASTQDESRILAALMPAREEALRRDRLLAALSCLTLAKAELLAGNREVALRDAQLAQGILGQSGRADAGGEPAGLGELLSKSVDSLSRGSSTAAEWLSLAWHELAEALVAAPGGGTP
jgi:hypothetical protein